ncbi:MAG: 2-oxoacid:acceptor oxidoreductase family protein, partial [Nanoarchaeota archaeon]|nr:2-oxoacid:acceptor oxidoreductase family protein [Nanoarchaeota archaeon]
AKAAGKDGKYTQAFGAYGPERRGAPVRAFCRIDDKPVVIRSHVQNPDYVIVLDPSLLGLPEVTEGLKTETKIMINGEKRDLNVTNEVHFFDASSLALNLIGKEIVNTAMLGVFSKVSNLVSLDSIKKAIEDNFPDKLAESNKKLVEESYNGVIND